MFRLVVDASADEIFVVDAYGNCEAATVEEEKKTPCVQMLVVVAAVVVLQVLAKSNVLRPET